MKKTLLLLFVFCYANIIIQKLSYTNPSPSACINHNQNYHSHNSFKVIHSHDCIKK
jgi:hypothetical protein